MSSTHRSNPLDRLRLWQKFLLLGLFAALAAVVPTYNMISKAQEGISFARDEQHGVPPSVAMLEVIHLVQQHRGLAATLLSGNESATQQRASKESEVNQAFVKAEQLLAPEFERSALLKERWVRLQQAWKNIVAGVTARSVEAGASIQAHADLVESTIVFVELIADHFKLSLDPYAHTYFLIQAVTVHFPRMSEAFAMARALGSVRLNEASRLRAAGQDAGKALTEADRQRMQTLLAAARDSADAGFRFIEKAAREEPRIRAQLESDLVLPREASRQMLQLAQRDLVDATGTVADAAAFNKTMSEGIDTQFKFLAASSQTLQQELDQVVATLRREQLTMSAQVLAAFAAAGLLGWLTVRNVRSTVEGLQRSVDKVRAGEATELPQIAARDEVGDLGRTVNQLLGERLEAQHRAEAENERLNNSVIQILHAVNQLSQRDLTVRAPVTEDVIGTVSDSINALTEETSRVLMGVSELATQVETASGEVRSKAELVSKTAEDERAGVERMIDALADAAQTMNQVAALAEQSNVAAEQATQVTHTALETVDGTVRGMESIRETIAETEKRIKRLGERSQEISGIVNLINTISERTHVLALNASMQAAVAGDAGRGFAVVAEEVQRLAESSRNATQQIGTLVSNIQLETNETISTVNRTIGQVVQGSELAQRAGEQMRRTQEITAQLVAQVQRIGDASESQKSMSAELLNAVQRIGQSTERTAEQIEAQNAETATLLQSARRLVESVNVFKLPQAA